MAGNDNLRECLRGPTDLMDLNWCTLKTSVITP